MQGQARRLLGNHNGHGTEDSHYRAKEEWTHEVAAEGEAVMKDAKLGA